MSVERAERARASGSIAETLEQLVEALGIVGTKADKDKIALDKARTDAEVMLMVERRKGASR